MPASDSAAAHLLGNPGIRAGSSLNPSPSARQPGLPIGRHDHDHVRVVAEGGHPADRHLDQAGQAGCTDGTLDRRDRDPGDGRHMALGEATAGSRLAGYDGQDGQLPLREAGSQGRREPAGSGPPTTTLQAGIRPRPSSNSRVHVLT